MPGQDEHHGILVGLEKGQIVEYGTRHAQILCPTPHGIQAISAAAGQVYTVSIHAIWTQVMQSHMVIRT